ncbi:NAD(P)H-binding protein [Kibdelosporangium persicum]|uniref:Nucleoside-diphosphate-sugar epimerase n=1 Tax=Kibdelosporangium persicum TaxID=2698649 RepID=A0ABX2EY87_9PSEU|nr:NAD(P)H-binding protein [Kibdelosporangium persicum]NRN64011.1 Nucleoside-diphosphate-sugar epimerase [Kibdelosporangium persicum]
MRVVIAGGHGKIALYLERFLATRGDEPVGLIRDPAQAEDLRDVGAEPVVLDLEKTGPEAVAKVLTGADAAVFAAGAGPGSGIQRKDTVDRAAAVLFAQAAEIAGVRRFLQVSSYGLDRAEDPSLDEVFRAYLKAKAAAEEDLRSRDLDWTILRPVQLTDEVATGLVNLDFHVPPGKIPREEVAAVLVALLDDNDTIGLTLELAKGPTPIEIAVDQVTSSTRSK